MSAFFVAVHLNNQALDPKLGEQMMSAISRFGGDYQALETGKHFAIGVRGKWCLPEEVGQRQPLVTADGRWFVFHGRVDNRHTLLEMLALPQESTLSDAELMMNFVIAHGQTNLKDVIGPFVFVLFDPRSNSLLAARDGMGGRYLAHYMDNDVILLATYELAIVAHDSVPYHLNDEKAARILMNEMEAEPSSTIAGVSPLKPGEKLSISGAQVELSRYYKPNPKKRIRMRNDEAYAKEFKRLLTQAVERRLRSVGKVGTMLSGGMDSVPMTIVAAQNFQSGLLAYSWVFDRYPDLDERRYSSPICDSFGIEQVMIDCDDVWPKFDDDTHANPIFPFGIPYSEFQQETFRQAQKNDVQLLLTGIHGDLLYEYGQGVFYELIRAGQWRKAGAEMKRFWQSSLPKGLWLKHYFLKPLAVVRKFTGFCNRNKPYPNDCLQDNIASLITKQEHWLEQESRAALRPLQWQVVMDGFAGEDMAHGRYMEAKYGIERRYPFRDRDLCEFMLAVPSDQLYFNRTTRPIVKQAFRNEFTPELLTRNDKTNFSTVIDAGIEQDSANLKWFQSSPPHWSYFVKECYFERNSAHMPPANVIKWRCGYYEYWKSVCYNPMVLRVGADK